MKDIVLGELSYEYGWSRPYSIEIFGDRYPVKLIIPCDEGDEIEDAQKNAFKKFEANRSGFVEASEESLFEYYRTIRDEYREKVGKAREDELVPVIESTQELKKVLTPKEVVIQQSFGTENRIVGILFDCTWEPALGLAVKFVNELINEVGSQDIVL